MERVRPTGRTRPKTRWSSCSRCAHSWRGRRPERQGHSRRSQRLWSGPFRAPWAPCVCRRNEQQTWCLTQCTTPDWFLRQTGSLKWWHVLCEPTFLSATALADFLAWSGRAGQKVRYFQVGLGALSVQISTAVNGIKPGSNEDESRWKLAGESLHECFLNSHCSVKRALRVAWVLTRVFPLFSISLFLLVASRLLFLRFLTLVKLLIVRVITPTVTRRWYVIIFSFFLLPLMGNDLEIACFCNSLRLSCNSHDRSNEPNLSSTLTNIWTSSKLMRVQESAWELIRVGGQTRARVATLIHSHPRLIRP